MEHKCEAKLPCGQHITILVCIIGIFSTILTSVVYATIDNRNKAVDEHRTMIQERARQDDSLKDAMSRNYAEIIQRLSRIESKLEK